MLVLGGLVTVAGVLLWNSLGGGPYKVVSVQEARTLIQEDSTLVILDVRTPGEFHGAAGHIAGALLIPVQELEARIGELDSVKGRPILAYCRTGNRSGTAAGILTGKGFTAMNMAGGIVDWAAKGFPVDRTPR